ncbi:hypothetical protein HK099_007363 [Clydaea vesicula]|uniref:Splicing factor U2AF subunit n=1 Tax=Clydaea vesicula TaxID=447962 RepID=A0AAD5TWI6_9FUNG|nr:hypothetical protein HK099_007363 [Clydaea vesicula]KAJ3390257.1 hypothetical protein HDU92_000582 [Lobulomyces angularis]
MEETLKRDIEEGSNRREERYEKSSSKNEERNDRHRRSDKDTHSRRSSGRHREDERPRHDYDDRDKRDYEDRERRERRRERDKERVKERSISPINLRKPKLKNWDLPPPGYDGMNVAQVKATGHFPLPGQPSRTGASAVVPLPFIHHKLQDGTASAATIPIALNPTIAKQSRRLYVGGIPDNANEMHIMEFFNDAMINLNFAKDGGKSVVGVQINQEKSYAFVEFRSNEEATSAMAFDGITYMDKTVKVRRPKDYIPPAEPEAPVLLPGVISTNVLDSPHKIFIGGLPATLNEEQVVELLKAFGELKAFNMVKDIQTGISKGFAFCEYIDSSITDIVCQGLNGMELGDKRLMVQRASIGQKIDSLLIEAGNRANDPHVMSLNDQMFSFTKNVDGTQTQPSTVILLMNMVFNEDIMNEEEYEDIITDIKQECIKFGEVTNVFIPKPKEEDDALAAAKVYVKFSNIEESGAALKMLSGREFGGRTVITSYYSEEAFFKGEYL